MHRGFQRTAVRVLSAAAVAWAVLALIVPAAAADTISSTEGRQFSGQVATVTAACQTPSSPTATINWGDGTPSSAGQVAVSGNQLTISGSHTYTEEGSYSGSVSGTYSCPPGTGPGGGPQSFTASFTASVADAALSGFPGNKLTTDSNDTFSGRVATFEDSGGESASDYTATIDWGDGSSSAGTIAACPGTFCISTFFVSGSHTYATKAATYTVTVTVHDDGGSSTVITDTMAVPTPPPCALSGWGGPYSQPPYSTSLSYQISGAQPVYGSDGNPTGQTTETVWMGDLAYVTPGCWYSVGDAGPPSDGQAYAPTIHFMTYSSVAINGVYFVPESNDSVLEIGSDGSIVAANWCGLLPLKLSRDASRRAGDACDPSTTYYVEVPENLGQSGPLIIIGQVDLGKHRITDAFSSLGSFDAAPQGPKIGHNQINPGATITVPSYPAQYQAQVTASIDLPGISLGPGTGGPATAALNYYTQGPLLPGSGQNGGGGGGGSGPENPCLEHAPPDCKNVPFQLRLRRRVEVRARPVTWETPVRPHIRGPRAHAAAGFSCPPVNLAVPQADAFLGGLGIQNLSLTCDASKQYPWAGTGQLDFSWLPGGAALPSANFTFHLDQNGNFHDGFAQLNLGSPGVPVFATPPVNLTKLGIGIATHPTTFYGQASLNVLAGLLQIDGDVLIVNADPNDQYTYPGCQPKEPCPPLSGVSSLQTNTTQHPISTFAAGLSGTITLNIPYIGPTELGGAYVFYVYPAYFEFGACLGPPVSGQNEGPGINCQGLSFLDGFITVNGDVEGAADMKLGQYDVSGNLNVDANFPDPIGSISVFLGAEISNVGLGACGGIGTPLGNIDAYVWFKYNGDHSIGLGGCDNNWPIHVNVQRSQERDGGRGRTAQAVAPVGLDLARGTSSASLTVDGSGAPPRVTVTSPTGEQLSNPSPGHGAASRDILILPLTQLNETLVWVKHPAAGRWTVAPLADSPAITDLSYSTPLPPPKIATAVSASHGSFTLHYNLRDPAGRTVTFIEQSRGGVYHIIGTARGSRGSLRFRPAFGAAGSRRIMALISINGLPVRKITVGRYTAPRIPRAGTSRRVRIIRTSHSLIVTWRGAPGAYGYLVTAALTDGRHLTYPLASRRRRLAIRTYGPGTGARVAVYGIGPTGMLGRPAVARLAPPPPPARITGIQVRRTRRGLVISWHRSRRAIRYAVQITISGSASGTLLGFTDKPTLLVKDSDAMLQRGSVSRIAIAGVSLEGQSGPAGTLRYTARKGRAHRRGTRGRTFDRFE